MPRFAHLSRSRRILLGGGLFITGLVATTSATTFAQAGGQVAQAEATRVQRPLSEDPLIDQNLVASLPSPVALSTNPPNDTDQYIAAIGPAMRPLVTEFNAIWPTTGEITTYF